MAFFEEVGKKLTQASQTTIQKTKEIADVTKLNSQISDEENKVRSMYATIGQKYFEMYEEDQEAVFAEDILCIQTAQSKVLELREQINIVKGIKKCSSCGSEIAKTAAFCPACGAKTPIVEEAVAQEAPKKLCPHCNNEVEDSVVFCQNCGGKIAE